MIKKGQVPGDCIVTMLATIDFIVKNGETYMDSILEANIEDEVGKMLNGLLIWFEERKWINADQQDRVSGMLERVRGGLEG
jgi:hypothetical protein